MGTWGFSVLGSGRRVAVSAACLLVLALTVTGCAALGAALRTGTALQGAGYQDVNVNVTTGSGVPAGGAVSVFYSRGPAGNDQRDAQRAEKIVWDNFPGRFGQLSIVKTSGGCAGPVCMTQSNELASESYAQLAARFGPRPHGLDKASAPVTVPRSVVLGVGFAAVAVLAAGAVALTLFLRRKRSRPPGPPPPWQPGPPPWQPRPPGA